MSNPYIPETLVPVHLAAPAADAAGRTSVYISLKNATKAYILAYIDQGNAATILLSPLQATAVAGTGSKVLANAIRVWSNLDCAASNALVRRTDAVNYTTDAGVKKKVVVFEIDRTKLDVDGGFDCVGISTGASDAANITGACALVVPTHAGDTAVSFIAD